MKKIIFATDAAFDDFAALVYVLSQPSLKLLGIAVSGTGETHGPGGAANLARVCKLVGEEYAEMPIAYGRTTSLGGYGKEFPEDLRKMVDNILAGKGVAENPKAKISASSVELMRELIEKDDEKTTILAAGPLTDVAELIQAYPNLQEKIEEIVIMGGAVRVKGNIEDLVRDANNKVAEWNIYADPLAAKIVFESKIKTTLVPLDATNQLPLTWDFYHALEKQTVPSLKLIFQLLKDAVDKYGIEGFYWWDGTAAMLCADPNLGGSEKIAISMDLETAQTKPVEEGGTALNVFTKIPNPDPFLAKFIADIKDSQPALSAHGFFKEEKQPSKETKKPELSFSG